ncbi:hypothetical protein ACKFKG_13160 [Phormidesmis sp. 146-35]
MAFRQVSASQSQGAGAVPTLDLSPTWGLTVSFIKTGELVQQVRVGDPSRVVVDFDSPLSPAGISGAANSGTQSNAATGATVIYLRQLSTPLNLDLRLPNAARDTSQVPLTIITLDRANTRRLYQFRLILGKQTDYSTVEVVPDTMMPQPKSLAIRSQPGVSPLPSAKSSGQRVNPNPGSPAGNISQQFEQAIAQAQTQQLVVPGSSLTQRLQQMLGLLRRGVSLEAAAQQAGVPTEVISQLIR